MDDLINRQAAVAQRGNACENTCEVERTENDCISRQSAIESIRECAEAAHSNAEWDMEQGYLNAIECVEEEPSAQPEIKPIDYRDCANAMLKMWMDDVVTDGEYYRIMDKLNKHELERRNNG